MTKLTSGRVEKVASANVSADRYQFLSLKEAEPDLGLPTSAGQVFTSNTTGSRYWTTLDTGNVVETSNLYYSNARVLSNVSLMSINVLADVNTTEKQQGYGLIWDGNNWIANVITVSGTELSNVANTVLTIIQGQITGLQANNAIFSNTAAVANVAGLANVATFANVAGLANVATFANVAGLANVATFANVANISNIVVSISNFTTANLAEATSNLYFTNARSRLAISAGTGIIYDTANGIIIANTTSILSGLSTTVAELTTANVAEAASNLYYTNARSRLAISAGTGIIYDNTTGIISANLTNITANVTATINGLTTANVSEAISNLYYTNARSRLAISAGNGIVYDSTTGIISANVTATIDGLTTANVSENAASGNLYFTNARVYANVIALLPQYTGNLQLGNLSITNRITANILNIGPEQTGGTISGANTIATNTIIANTWIGLYTANVLEDGQSIFYTNARVFANVSQMSVNVLADVDITGINTNQILIWDGSKFIAGNSGTGGLASNTSLTTANVAELPSNLYYTNLRAYSNVISLLPYYTGTLSGNNITATNSATIGNLIVLGNLYVSGNNVSFYANNLVVNDPMIQLGFGNPGDIYDLGFIGHYNDGAIERHAGLFRDHTDQKFKFFDNLTSEPGLNDLDTANTTFRLAVIAAKTIEGNLIGNVTGYVSSISNFTTSNLVEGANLYFTNARVVSAVSASGILTTSNVFEYGAYNLYYTNIRVLSAVTPLLTTANVNEIASSGNLYYSNLRVNAYIQPWLTTANIAEVTNLYFTNDRVYANIAPLLTTANIAEVTNLYFTNTRVYSNIAPLLTTANVAEVTNQYFTNARAILTVIPAITELLVTTPGMYYSIDQYTGNNPAIDVRAGETISFSLNAPGHPFMIRVSAGGSNYDTGLTHIDTDGTISTGSSAQGKVSGKLFWKIPYSLAGSTYVYQCSVHGGMVGSIVISKSVNSTTDLNEGSNLYYSNDRVYSNVIGLLNAKANVVDLTTSNIIELNNLYYTNARVYANVITLLANLVGDIRATGNITTDANLIANGLIIRNINVSDNVLAGNITANATISNAIVAVTINATGNITTDANLIANGLIIRNINVADSVLAGNVTANATISNVIIAVSVYATGNITTDANLIANGLIIRNINVSDSVLTGNVIAGNTTSNIILADSITANIWNRLYTANVIETSGNLYFTNARSRAALSAGLGIIYDTANGIIASSSVVTILSDSVTVISTGNLSYNIGTSVSDPKRILVSIEGMLQIPTTDYSVSGSTLTFPGAPPIGANIEVKFFGTETLNSTPTLVSKVDSFVATGSSAVFNLSMFPTSKDYVTVLIDGVLQQSDVYTLNGNTITLSDYPAVGSNVDIRMIGGRVGSSYNTRTFTGNGAANAFTLTNGFTNDTVLVFENGVAQMPVSDYTITNDVLTFTTAPAANVIVQVRELGIAGPNVAAAISGFDQVTGNLVPTLDLIKNLGSSTKRWNQLYLKSNGLVLGNVTIGATDTTLTLTSNTGAITTLYTSLTAARAAAFGLSLIFGG